MASLLKRLWVIVILMLSSGMLAQGETGKVLTWIGEGRSPEDKSAGSVGELVYINTDGTSEKLLDIPANVEGIYPCGEGATSPDGQYFAFFVNTPAGGQDRGTLYQITESGQPAEVAAAHAMSCIGNGTFQYSPDSTRFAYIDYDELPSNGEYALGTLRLFDSESREEVVNFPDVGGFYLNDNTLELLQYYKSNQNIVDEIGVVVYENESSTEIATLFAEPECRFSSAQLTPANDQLVIFTGHRCSGRATSWQLYTVNPDGTNFTLAVSNTLGSPFANNARTNTQLPSADGETLIFTTPDGLSSNTVSVNSIPMTSLAVEGVNTLITRGAVMPRYNSRTFSLPENAFPRYSANRRWWAAAVADGSRRSVNIIDLNNPTAPPVASTTSDNILSLNFHPESTELYYVAGEREGEANTLAKINLESGEVTTIATGAYGGGVMSPDGAALALMMWQDGTDSRTTRYQTLAVVDPSDGSVTETLFEGIVYNESDELRARRFAYPLAFRR
jgi:hypothetical protein